ncbi:MAG: hypothetical protein QM692_13765 [Thermomicrobiales bacterium]
MAADQELDVHPSDAAAPSSQFGQDNHRAFIDGIEVCAERFADDEQARVNCFAEVVSTTIGKRASKRTGTAIPADSAESRRRGSAHAHAALRAKRAAAKAAAEAAAAEAAAIAAESTTPAES